MLIIIKRQSAVNPQLHYQHQQRCWVLAFHHAETGKAVTLMSKDKNFKINRNKHTPNVVNSFDVKLGDVFEREGSLHMKVANHELLKGCPPDMIAICNLNTGSVWAVRDEEYTPVKNCTIDYNVEIVK